MTKIKRSCFSLVCFVIGGLLIVFSVGYLVYTMVSSRISCADNEKIVNKIEMMLPDPTDAFPEERGNNSMPSLEIEGVDIVGVLEILRHSVKLPVRSAWSGEAVKGIPCLYTGSIYDCSLLIGATDSTGQMDCISDITVSEKLYLTDMEGDRYTYSVTAIKHSDTFKPDKWITENADFVLFVQNTLSGEYTVLCCMAE